VVNPNPLATTPQPATAGTKISLLALDVRPLPPAFYRVVSRSGGVQQSIQEHPDESKSSTTEGRGSSSDAGGAVRNINSSDLPTLSPSAPAFGEGNALLAPPNTKDANKRRKPKNNMTKSNSSFISRVIVHETLGKKLQERSPDGLFAFANINRAFQWIDLSSPTKVRMDPTTAPTVGQTLTATATGRVPDQDPVHQSALPLPRCQQADQKLVAH